MSLHTMIDRPNHSPGECRVCHSASWKWECGVSRTSSCRTYYARTGLELHEKYLVELFVELSGELQDSRCLITFSQRLTVLLQLPQQNTKCAPNSNDFFPDAPTNALLDLPKTP